MIVARIKAFMLGLEIAMMRAHITEWEESLRRVPQHIAEYERRIVEAEALRRDLLNEGARARVID